MSLPIEDALLLVVLLVSMCLLLAADVAAVLARWGRRAALALRGTPPAPPWPKASQRMSLQDGPQRTPGARPPRQQPSLPALPQVADLLLVDDSAVARAKLRRLFEANGYKVHLAGDGVEALALLAKGRYGMMITDLEMPNMDGVTLVAECVKQPQTAGMPIIAVSAHENLRAIFNECRHVCGVHRKPWVDDVLLSHVATLVSGRSPMPLPARVQPARLEQTPA